LATDEPLAILGSERGLMDEELRLLRQAHEEQAKHIVSERVVLADRIRLLELRAEQLEERVEQLTREIVDEHERARQHVEAARGERDAAVRQLEEFQQTPTYRLVMLMHRVLSRGPGRAR
jgi:hypothetical protein